MANCNCKNENIHEPGCKYYTTCKPQGSNDYCGGCDYCMALQDSGTGRHFAESEPFVPAETKKPGGLSKGDTLIYMGAGWKAEEIQEGLVFFYEANPNPYVRGMSVLRLPRDVAEFLFRSQQK